MTITDGYVALDVFKRYANINGTADDSALEVLIESVSRAIDATCGHQFYPQASATARVFAATATDLIEVDDIGSTTGLVIKTDQNYDGTFEYTWSSTDYQLEPVNNLSKGRAVWRIRRKVFGLYWFPVSDETLVQVTAQWGWPAIPRQIVTATMMQCNRLWSRRQAPLGVIMDPAMGQVDRLSSFDVDVQAYLRPFMRFETAL